MTDITYVSEAKYDQMVKAVARRRVILKRLNKLLVEAPLSMQQKIVVKRQIAELQADPLKALQA